MVAGYPADNQALALAPQTVQFSQALFSLADCGSPLSPTGHLTNIEIVQLSVVTATRVWYSISESAQINKRLTITFKGDTIRFD